METRIRPLSSPCEFGFVVFGRLTSGPFRICGAITMKMIRSTSTTSTSGVMLMAACIRAGSPSRIGRTFLLDRRRLDVSRNCDEDTHRRRDQGLSDAARNHRHSAGPCGRDAPESVDDSDHSAEKTNERGRGADCGKKPETTLQLNQRFGNRVPECASDELERSGPVASALPHAVVLDDARRDHLCHVGIRVQPPGFDQILDITPVKELLELGLELFRLTRG